LQEKLLFPEENDITYDIEDIPYIIPKTTPAVGSIAALITAEGVFPVCPSFELFCACTASLHKMQ
jgi:hypothetical protein